MVPKCTTKQQTKSNPYDEAADEIESLRERVKELEDDANEGMEEYAQLVAKHLSCAKELAALKSQQATQVAGQGEPCAACGGTGQVLDKESCIFCHGTGKESSVIRRRPAPTIPEGWLFAGWQQRYIDPDHGPSKWQPCSERDAEMIGGRKDYELRKVFAAVPKPEEIK